MSTTVVQPSLTPEEARLIDQACDRFESAWKTGSRPDVDDYLGGVKGQFRSALLRQLLMLDWDYRILAGEQPSVSEYRERFNDDSELIVEVGLEMNRSPASTQHASRVDGGNTLRSPSGSATCAADLKAFKDSIAERYELGPEVGHGGIGIVYRGRDLVLGRDLAIKVLRETYADRSDARNRFIAEARVGSQLQHPAIVPVYELGWCESNRPYITMKLVEGQTLAELLKHQTHTHGEWSPAELPRLLSVFEQVCQAMAYAHSKGIVHRDLKPANIMVGAFGEVQVMDWGFAKQLRMADAEAATAQSQKVADRSSVVRHTENTNPIAVTHSGAMMGTPAYMPPEQARGEVSLIDARTDVFALGAILCEILTGAPPYSGGTAEEMCKRAAAGDLADALGRLADCPSDRALCDVARRCLNQVRENRPPTAGDVAKELTDYLDSAQESRRQAQLKQAASQAREKSERRARRLTLALAAALLIGAGIATWQAVVATHAKNDALAAAAAEKTAKDTADAKELESRSILDFFVNTVVARARPKTERGGMGPDVTIRAALKNAVLFVGQYFSHEPLIEARLRYTLGESFYSLGEYPIAAEQFQKARKLYADHGDQQRVLSCMVHLSNTFEQLGQDGRALELRQQLLNIQKDALGLDHPETLDCMMDVANSLHRTGRTSEAIELHEKTLALKKEKLGATHRATLTSMFNLATSYYAIGRRAEALRLREEVLQRRRELLSKNDPLLLISAVALSGSYYSAGRYDEAVRLLEPTIQLQKETLGADHPDTLAAMNNLGNCYAALRRHEDTLKLRLETLDLLKSARGPDHPETLKAMSNLANAYSDLKRFDEGINLLLETIELQKKRLGPSDAEVLRSMSNLAVMYNLTDRPIEALKLHQEVLAKRRAKLKADHPDILRSLQTTAISLVKLNRGAEAVPLIDECLRLAHGQLVHPALVPNLVDQRIRIFEAANDADGCRATAEMWESLKRTDPQSCFLAARYRAITARILRAAGPAAEKQATEEADRAMAWLNKAIVVSNADISKLEKNQEFDALRDREDFRRLIERIRSRQ